MLAHLAPVLADHLPVHHGTLRDGGRIVTDRGADGPRVVQPGAEYGQERAEDHSKKQTHRESPATVIHWKSKRGAAVDSSSAAMASFRSLRHSKNQRDR